MTVCPPKILITGANGFTGRHACNHFSSIGMEVTAVVRKKRPLLTNLSYEVKECDLTYRKHVIQLMQAVKPNYILHLAGRNSVPESWREPVSYMTTNMTATLHLLDALRCINHPCRTLVVGSMLNFNITRSPQPPHPYSLSKTFQVLASQCWGHLFKLHIMIAQPSNLIGPGYSNGICGLLAKNIVDIERGKNVSIFKFSSLTEERDFLDVRDAVVSYEKILLYGKKNSVYSIGSGRNRSLGELVKGFQSIVPNPLQFEVGQTKSAKVSNPIDLSAINALNWKPVISFEQSLKEILQFYRCDETIDSK
jgi:nucleoside-diphosphate-sugar epimerase